MEKDKENKPKRVNIMSIKVNFTLTPFISDPFYSR
ncbi:MAG: hypothetical protein ACJA13_000894 [Paraglaciecola sp.]|jgi:hypothetical protein